MPVNLTFNLLKWPWSYSDHDTKLKTFKLRVVGKHSSWNIESSEYQRNIQQRGKSYYLM